MTRLNVYAGPAGFYLVRGGPAGDATVLDSRTGLVRVASRPGASGERQVPPEQALPGDPDRDPGSLLQRGRLALLPRLAHVLRRAGRRLHPRRAVLSDLESGVLRQHDHGQRQHVAVPRSRAAPLPLPLPQRLPVTLPDPRLRRDPGRRGLADRERGRLPRDAGRRHGRPRQPAAHGPCRAGRRDRRLHQRAGGEPRTRQRRSRRAVRRRHPRGRLPRRRSRHDRPDHAVQRRARGRSRHVDATAVPAAARDRAAPGRDDDPAAGSDREGGRGRGRRRRGGRGAGRGPARHGRRRRSRWRSSGWTP